MHTSNRAPVAALVLATLVAVIFGSEAGRTDGPVQTAKTLKPGTARQAILSAERVEAEEVREIVIPANAPFPPAGEERRIAIPPGAVVRLEDEAMLMDAWPDGDALVVQGPEGGVLVLDGALAERDSPIRIIVGDVELPPGALAALFDTAAMAPAAGAPSGGGGEVFTLVSVVSWFIDRVDFASEARAQEPDDEAAPGGTGMDLDLLGRIDLQMRIARAGEVLAAATAHRERMAGFVAELERMVESGVVSNADLVQARTLEMGAELEHRQAEYDLVLAVDRHQDVHGERLETARYPTWDFTLAADVAEARQRARLGEADRARRNWRQAKFATDMLALLAPLGSLTEELCMTRKEHYDVGRVSFGELAEACGTIFEVRVRQAQMTFELRQAEAWLLAAQGGLQQSMVLQPGWQ